MVSLYQMFEVAKKARALSKEILSYVAHTYDKDWTVLETDKFLFVKEPHGSKGECWVTIQFDQYGIIKRGAYHWRFQNQFYGEPWENLIF